MDRLNVLSPNRVRNALNPIQGGNIQGRRVADAKEMETQTKKKINVCEGQGRPMHSIPWSHDRVKEFPTHKLLLQFISNSSPAAAIVAEIYNICDGGLSGLIEPKSENNIKTITPEQ